MTSAPEVKVNAATQNKCDQMAIIMSYFRPFRKMNICPTEYNFCQSVLKILTITRYSIKSLPTTFGQSGKMSPNQVALVTTEY